MKVVPLTQHSSITSHFEHRACINSCPMSQSSISQGAKIAWLKLACQDVDHDDNHDMIKVGVDEIPNAKER